MKQLSAKILSTLFLFLLIATFNNVHAETTGSYGQSCMPKEAVYMETLTTPLPKVCQSHGPCITPPAGFQWPGGTHKDHTVKISGTEFPPTTDIYVVGCVVSGNNKMRCTTGSSTTDNELKQLGFTPKPFDGHQFNILQNPMKSDSAGKLTTAVRSYTEDGENHKFFGLFAYTPVPTGPELVRETGGNTLQYGTFNFSDGLPEDPGTCVGIFWDPKGRTFDSKSLEPIPDVKVKLFVEENGVKIPVPAQTEEYSGVKRNPLNTRFNGLFEFFVPNGIYYLQPVKEGYTFPLPISEVNSNYSKAYFCDKEVGQPLYNNEFPIVEENKVTHCDIPLDPGTNPPLRREAEIKDFLVMNIPGRSAQRNVTQISGLVSHPLSTIILVGETTGKEYARAKANKFGQWTINLSASQVPQNEALIAKPVKADLTKTTSFIKEILNTVAKLLSKTIYAQETTGQSEIVIQPIFRYIEGFAYGPDRQVIQNARVEIRLEDDKSLYAFTTADQTGFFSFAPNELPFLSYYIQYSGPDGATYPEKTTSQFAKENEKHLSENNIRLSTATKNGTPVPTKAVILVSKETLNEPTASTVQPTIVTQGQGNSSVMNMLILMVLVALAVVLAFYIYKKTKFKSPPPPSSPQVPQ